EIDPAAIGRVVRAVIVAVVGSEALFRPGVFRKAVEIEISFALGAVGQPLAIRRPAMKVTGLPAGDLPRSAAGRRKNVDLPGGNGEPVAVRRDAVIVIDTVDRGAVHCLRLAARERKRPELALR